jgi:hypothetical protein
VTLHREFPLSEIEAIKIGNAEQVYVWGRTSYADVFHRQHNTYFCFSYFGAVAYQNVGVNSGTRAENRDYCHHPDSD